MTLKITEITEFLTSIWNEKAVSCKSAVTEKGKSHAESEQKINSEAEEQNSALPPSLLGNICFIIGPVAIYSVYPPSVCNGVLVLRCYGSKRERRVVRASGKGTAAELMNHNRQVVISLKLQTFNVI